jgi:hypothetical protein
MSQLSKVIPEFGTGTVWPYFQKNIYFGPDLEDLEPSIPIYTVSVKICDACGTGGRGGVLK